MNNGLYMKYFVLSPTKNDGYGAASRAAILAYASIVESFNAELAHDLRGWIAALEGKDG